MATTRTLLVEYDLSKPGQNYTGLIEYLESFGTYAHHLKSAWMVRTSMTPVEVRDKVAAFVDSNDKVMVVDVTSGPAAWTGLSKELSDWIKKYL